MQLFVDWRSLLKQQQASLLTLASVLPRWLCQGMRARLKTRYAAAARRHAEICRTNCGLAEEDTRQESERGVARVRSCCSCLRLMSKSGHTCKPKRNLFTTFRQAQNCWLKHVNCMQKFTPTSFNKFPISVTILYCRVDDDMCVMELFNLVYVIKGGRIYKNNGVIVKF